MVGVNSLPKTVTRQRRGCDLNPGPSAPESSTLTTRLPSHPFLERGGGIVNVNERCEGGAERLCEWRSCLSRAGIRRLQRLQLESMAPLLTHVDASVRGLASIHAYDRLADFQLQSVAQFSATIRCSRV